MRVNSAGEEFLEGSRRRRKAEKIGPGIAEGMGDDPFGGRDRAPGGADIGVEIGPHAMAEAEG